MSRNAKTKEKRKRKMMYAQYGVRQATKTETEVFKKVDAVITDELAERVFDEDVRDLLKGIIRDADLVRELAELGLDMQEVCIWYFMT
jgi:hypothetical protein